MTGRNSAPLFVWRVLWSGIPSLRVHQMNRNMNSLGETGRPMLSKRTQFQLSVKSLSVIVVLTCSHLALAAEPQQTPTAPLATQPGLQAAATPPAGQAAIVVDAAEFDFGSVRAGEKVEHRFKVTNTGTAELKITNVKTNCGCTVAGDYPKPLAPGASGEIPPAFVLCSVDSVFLL